MKKVTFTSWVLSITSYITIMTLSYILFKEYLPKYKNISLLKLDYIGYIELILFIVLILVSTYNFVSYSYRYLKQVSNRRKNKRKREDG